MRWLPLSLASLVLIGTVLAEDLEPTPAQLGEGLAGTGVLVGNTSRRMLHFTFDDGPHAVQTPRLLDVLDEFGVKATFFFSASRFASPEERNSRAGDIAREVARRGHPIGSHSFDHVKHARLTPKELRHQLARGDAMFDRVFGTRSHLFRPPKGSSNRALERMLRERRDVIVMWNVGLADWVERPPEAVRDTFFKVLQRNARRDGDRGGIVLLHDTHGWSVDAFVLIMEALQARNCELLSAGEELYDVVDSLDPWVAPREQAEAEHARRQQELKQRAARRCSAAVLLGKPAAT